MPSTIRPACLLLLLAAGCSGSSAPPPQPPPRTPTVFDDLVEQKRVLPGKVVAAQEQHMQDAQRAIDGPDAPPPAESKR